MPKNSDEDKCVPPNYDILEEQIQSNYTQDFPQTTGSHVDFERVVRIDLCGNDGDMDLNVKRLDLDFSQLFNNDCEQPPSKLVRLLRHGLANQAFGVLKNIDLSLCSKDFPGLDEVFKKYDLETGKKTNHSQEAPIGKAGKRKGNNKVDNAQIELSTLMKLGKKEYSLDQLVNASKVIPSSFDLDFRGPTAVIYRSNIRHLRFRPDPFIFLNPRDEIYYRNQEVSRQFTQASFMNAYSKGNAIDNLPTGTPYNQEHKIDLAMVLCVWGQRVQGKKNPCEENSSDSEECSEEWLFTPIKIDPPMNNSGGGGGLGGD